MREHELKTDPEVFQQTAIRKKLFEIRFNDRNYQEGDILFLRETEFTGEEMKAGKPLKYTGRTLRLKVIYVLHGPIYGLAAGWVVMSVRRV